MAVHKAVTVSNVRCVVENMTHSRRSGKLATQKRGIPIKLARILAVTNHPDIVPSEDRGRRRGADVNFAQPTGRGPEPLVSPRVGLRREREGRVVERFREHRDVLVSLLAREGQNALRE